MVHKKYTNNKIKITVEEVPERHKNGMFITYIATCWYKDFSLEKDREVIEFETFGGAMEQAFNFLVESLK